MIGDRGTEPFMPFDPGVIIPFPPLPPTPAPATCPTGRVVALAAAGFALGAATTVAVALVTEAVVRRLGRAIDEAELADWFPTGWLR